MGRFCPIFRSPEPKAKEELLGWAVVRCRLATLSNDISSEATGPIYIFGPLLICTGWHGNHNPNKWRKKMVGWLF